MDEYLVIYESGEEGTWGAYSPDLWGVYAAADTRKETAALMREAGIEVPEPTHQLEYIAA